MVEKKNKKLNDEQQRVLDSIVSNKKNAVILGDAGTGKSVLVDAVTNALTEAGEQVVVCAPTGRAADAVGGTTIHQLFGLSSGVCLTESRKRIKACTTKALRNSTTVIVDEISMVRMDLFESIVASFEKIKKQGNQIRLICVGDFHQLPPVVTDAERAILEKFYGRGIDNGYAFQSQAWAKCNFDYFVLRTVMRQDDDIYIQALNRMKFRDTAAISYINACACPVYIENSTIILQKNSDVDKINQDELRRIPGDLYTIYTHETGNLSPSDRVGYPGELRLKVGARVMITENDTFNVKYAVISNPNGLKKPLFHNGSMGTVKKVNRNYYESMYDSVVVELDSGVTLELYRAKKCVYEYGMAKGKVKRRSKGSINQIPLRLAYALTCHRAQGMTLDTANVMPGGWAPGQMYVALSRVKSIKDMHLIQKIKPEDIILDPLVAQFYQMVEAIIANNQGQ